jgi:hypothetical protein
MQCCSAAGFPQGRAPAKAGFQPSGLYLDYVWGIVAWTKRRSPSRGGELMSKGMDRKKEGKKKPAKSLQEKRAAKREKKQSRGFQV